MGTAQFNLLFVFLAVGSFLLFAKMMYRNRKIKELFRIEKEMLQTELKPKKQKRKLEFRYLESLKKRVNMYYFFERDKKKPKRMYMSILGVELALFMLFVLMREWFLAIVFPLLVHWFVLKALELKSISIHAYIQKELPLAIRHLIKIMTKINDLKTVMYETSKHLNEPLRSKFFDLSRRMVTENYEKCLMEFAEELDDTWIYAFAFLLVNYKEQSKKADIIKNLAMLSDMLEKENYLRERGLTDKKSIIVLNYSLAAISVAAFALNFAFNKYAYDFFFNSIGGMISLLIGFAAVLATLLMNLFLTKNPGQSK